MKIVGECDFPIQNSHTDQVGSMSKGAFLLSELAGRTSQLANEIGFFHRVFAEKLSPSCILFRI